MNRTGAVSVVRKILTAVYTLAAVLLQCSVFPRLRLLGAIPEITLCVIVCVSCFEDAGYCSVLAVCAGFVLDTLGSDRFTLSPLLFLLAAAFSIFIRERLWLHRSMLCLISASAAFALGGLKTFILLITRGAPAGPVLLHSVLPQILYGFIVFFPVFLLTWLHHRVFRGRSEQEYRSA